MPINTRSPEHWRQRAEEARRQAEQMHDPAAKRAMLAVAESYETIAKRAEELQASKSN
jgi:hypothetical protein